MVFKYNFGDRVFIVRSGRNITKCFGGWNDDMDDFVGDDKVYIVTDRFSSGGRLGYRLCQENAQSGMRWSWDERLLEPAVPEIITPGMSVADLMGGSNGF